MFVSRIDRLFHETIFVHATRYASAQCAERAAKKQRGVILMMLALLCQRDGYFTACCRPAIAMPAATSPP